MLLYHISETGDTEVFQPRMPSRWEDAGPGGGLVWAVEEELLPAILAPANCPRVTYSAGMDTQPQERMRFFSSASALHVVAVEWRWFETFCTTPLYLYAFDEAGFMPREGIAGYYVSEQSQRPLHIERIDNVPQALCERKVELRVVDNLWNLYDAVAMSSLRFSMSRMAYAQSRDVF